MVASAASGMAHAWTNGDFNGSVDIGGSITADDYRQKWSWAIGSGLNGFSNVLTDLTENGTKLTIAVNGDKPILLGKTNEAFATLVAGGVGAIPQIAFTDYQKSKVTPVFADTGNTGIGYLELPVVDEHSSPIGLVKVNMTAAGVRMLSEVSRQRGVVGSLYAGSSDNIFFGGVPASADGSLTHGYTTAKIIAGMGGVSSADLLAQLVAVDPSITSTAASTIPLRSSMTKAVTAAAYAMGMKSGQTLEVVFTKPVTQSTVWKAPLNIAVTYQ